MVEFLNQITTEHGTPKRIRCDNGSEFAGRLVDLWTYANGVVMEFARSGKPADNAFIESFNGSLRDECLNVHWFDDLTDAQKTLQAWRRETMKVGLTGLSMSSRPWNSRPVGPNKGQNLADALAQEMGHLRDDKLSRTDWT